MFSDWKVSVLPPAQKVRVVFLKPSGTKRCGALCSGKHEVWSARTLTPEIIGGHGLWWGCDSCFVCVCVCGRDRHSFSGSNSGTMVYTGRRYLSAGRSVVVGGGLVELHCQKHLAKFLFLWPSSFVFLMWCLCTPFEKRGCSCHFYWRSFIVRLNGLKWQLSFPSLLLSFFFFFFSPSHNLTHEALNSNQRKFALPWCAQPPLSHPSPLLTSNPNCKKKRKDSRTSDEYGKGVFL